jgi:hypothetical protein
MQELKVETEESLITAGNKSTDDALKSDVHECENEKSKKNRFLLNAQSMWRWEITNYPRIQ